MDINLLSLFFPQGLLDYFDVSDYEESEHQFSFLLKEKNIPPTGYEKSAIESKGFYDGGHITDFPIRGKKCLYKVRRRKWIEKETGKVITRDWDIIAKGTRITEEFASFLKELNR